jgi:hypothetical protein
LLATVAGKSCSFRPKGPAKLHFLREFVWKLKFPNSFNKTYLEDFMGVSGKTHTQEQLDHYADQHNPNNDAYQANLDNHANQLNPDNDEYWHSRREKRPE